jgi:YfiH family protein
MLKSYKITPWITPTWSAPRHVKALSTVRQDGASPEPYGSFNLGFNVGDDPLNIIKNRQTLLEQAVLPSEPAWLVQTHGIKVVTLDTLQRSEDNVFPKIEADASICFKPGLVCVAMTADCLPVLLCDKKGTRVAAVHAGWRGLASGIVEATVQALDCDPLLLKAWLGPAIGPTAFEVGIEVKQAFLKPGDEGAFQQKYADKWTANLYHLATLRLKNMGVTDISGGEFCTFTDEKRFYSFRRSTPVATGRMASLIWLED